MNFFSKSLLLILTLVFSPIIHAELSINNEEYTPSAKATWKTHPNISVSELDCQSKSQLDIIAEWHVSKQGKIKAIYLLKSSGNLMVDKRIINQLKTAEFYPFIKNGEPVEGEVKLPIRIVCD